MASARNNNHALNIRYILNKVSLPVTRNWEFFVFMYALGIVSAICTVVVSAAKHLYDNAWWELFLDLYVVGIVLAVLPRRIRLIAKAIIYAVVYPVTIADVYCYVKFDAPLNPSILMLVGETDKREAGEFFTAYLSPDIIGSYVGWILLIMLLHILWTIHRHWRRPRRLATLCDTAAKKLRRLRLIFSLILIPLIITAVIMSWQNYRELHSLMSQQTIGDVEHRLTEKDHGEQFLPMYRLTFSLYANHLAGKQIGIIRKVANDAKVDSCSFTSPNIVLIIGEAYNKYHSQLYGYERPTTPRQLQLRKEGSLVSFDDVISPWNLTSYVFKHIMSLYSVGDKGDWCDYPLFCNLFRKAGYHVTFLTNEFLPQAKQAVYDFSGGFFMNDAELSAAQFDSRNSKLHVFDEGLLEDYRIVQEQRAHDGDTLQRGNLTIFHLMGQHQDYRIRCPNSKKHFHLDDYADRSDLIQKRWKQGLCNYDNATLYNDSIVREIVRLFEKTNTLVIYMPDHGEEVHSRELPHFNGRMHSTAIVPRLAKYEFGIPFWIWASPEYQRQHPDIWQQVKAAHTLPYMTDALPHLLLYLAGIHCTYYRPDLNILSPKYNSRRPRIIKHQVDYDEVMKKTPH